MSRLTAAAALLAALLLPAAAPAGEDPTPPPGLVIHGGAGSIDRGDLTPEEEAEYRAALEAALATGWAILEAGGSSLDAVEKTIRQLEDSPLFNAGRGAVFTADGRNELDASIMDGVSRRAGAVAGVTTLKHPISAARAVMERSKHVLLAGDGAEEFARSVGLETVPPEYFWTEKRWKALERARERERLGRAEEDETLYLGTVGAVARDRAGRIAAGTSTGGMTNKRHGRVGDSPIIGAGTYADDGCGVSSTGHGEYFIRYSVAHDVCARSRYLGIGVREAAREVIANVLGGAGGKGGVIALDRRGRPVLEFNTAGMYRGWIDEGGKPRVAVYGE
ncbi:MAG: isoaspartyl peptidase/L-asparaginase [Thermoanaerobaculia bacterium]|nr:isoaspartyl peptidase/L-asparaginase [Thermoanaerobaculia bacterium]